MTQPPNTALIVNPMAGGGKAWRKWQRISNSIRKILAGFNQFETTARGHGIEIARQAIEHGAERLVVVGGDGTINEVANGILTSSNPECELGIIPLGTGDDFLRSFDVPPFAFGGGSSDRRRQRPATGRRTCRVCP